MLLDFNKGFPEAEDGSQGPLPKQKLFLDMALAKGTPKYIRYLGGIGSGKTLIGCITMLTWAVMYPGDYLVARQFMPELRDTTLKTFLEIVQAIGPALLVEYRVADAIVKIRAQGGVSTILFRGLEEPDKLRSLNLNGFYIDEAAQTTEAAFILLQGRLRGKHVRKGILTQNSGGMDWTYRWFVKQDHIKNEEVKKQFYNIKAPSTENTHLPTEYVATILETWSDDKIQREIYADETAFAGQVYADFRHDVHVIKPFRVPDNWTRVVGVDHGYRNPAAWVWGAIDPDGTLFIYREFYQKEWIIEEICKGKPLPGGRTIPGVVELSKTVDGAEEKFDYIKIDPSTRAVRGATRRSDWDVYADNLPLEWALQPANNEKTAGIDRIKTLLKVNPKTKKPLVFFFETCPNLIEEMVKYRYDELATSRLGKVNEKEDPRKVDDHALDAFRYLVMGQPEPRKAEEDIWEKIKYNSLEGSMYRDLQLLKNPRPKDPFGDL